MWTYKHTTIQTHIFTHMHTYLHTDNKVHTCTMHFGGGKNMQLEKLSSNHGSMENGSIYMGNQTQTLVCWYILSIYPFSTETMIYWKAFRIFPWPGCHCFEQTQVALKIPASWTCANRTVQKTVSQNCFWENHNVVQTRKKKKQKRFGRCLKTKRVQQKKCSMWQWKKSQLLEVCILL